MSWRATREPVSGRRILLLIRKRKANTWDDLCRQVGLELDRFHTNHSILMHELERPHVTGSGSEASKCREVSCRHSVPIISACSSSETVPFPSNSMTRSPSRPNVATFDGTEHRFTFFEVRLLPGDVIDEWRREMSADRAKGSLMLLADAVAILNRCMSGRGSRVIGGSALAPSFS